MIVTIEDRDIIEMMCKGKVLVATTGTFDLLHAGHVGHLENCKKLGDYLIVLLTSDERTRQKKGPTRPIIPQEQRAKILDSLRVVDFVITGFIYPKNSSKKIIDNLQILEIFRPQMFVVENYGWEDYREILENWGIKLIIKKEISVRITTTSQIINTIIDRYET